MASEQKEDSNPTKVDAVPPVQVSAPSTRKRGKLNSGVPALDAVTAGALSTAAQTLSTTGYHGLATLLTGSLTEPFPSIIPNAEQVKQAAKKACSDQPVWPHWSKQDMAPQFKVDSSRLQLTGALRGYRMARASHGISSGCYYFECLILPGPSATEILSSLPSNARLGPGLRDQLKMSVEWEDNQHLKKQNTSIPSDEINSNKKQKREEVAPVEVGGHLRIGWSMRTGDLQAPVGYDKWSYGIRDVGGSIVHCSRRKDDWGGEGFGPGDVVGCAISFDETNSNNNQIRYFKNGDCMGQFYISKGKREGGEAFSNVKPGTYYPAVSCYMGGSCRVNFGPHWLIPPKRSRLPGAFKNMNAISSICPPPASPRQAADNFLSTLKLFKKTEHQHALKTAITAEAEIQGSSYSSFLKGHETDVRAARIARGLAVADLPQSEEEKVLDAQGIVE